MKSDRVCLTTCSRISVMPVVGDRKTLEGVRLLEQGWPGRNMASRLGWRGERERRKGLVAVSNDLFLILCDGGGSAGGSPVAILSRNTDWAASAIELESLTCAAPKYGSFHLTVCPIFLGPDVSAADAPDDLLLPGVGAERNEENNDSQRSVLSIEARRDGTVDGISPYVDIRCNGGALLFLLGWAAGLCSSLVLWLYFFKRSATRIYMEAYMMRIVMKMMYRGVQLRERRAQSGCSGR